MMSLPARQQRTLNRIEQTLVAEDPGLGLRFGVFTSLTVDEEMPGTERVPGRLRRFRRAGMAPPLMMIGLLAVSWPIPAADRHGPRARTRLDRASRR
jgi:hypothetical protein